MSAFATYTQIALICACLYYIGWGWPRRLTIRKFRLQRRRQSGELSVLEPPRTAVIGNRAESSAEKSEGYNLDTSGTDRGGEAYQLTKSSH